NGKRCACPTTFSRVPHARLSQRSKINSRTQIAPEIEVVRQDRRRLPTQPEKYRCRSSAWRLHLCHRCFRFRQIDADPRCSLSKASASEGRIVRSGARRVQICGRRASDRRRGNGRSSAACPYTAFDTDSLSRPLRSGARIVRRPTGSDGARTYSERVFVQFGQWTLRPLLRHRFRKDRDAILERSLRTLRRVRRQPFSTARVECETAPEIDPRFARADCERSNRVLRPSRRRNEIVQAACCARGSWPRLSAARSTTEHTLRRRIAAVEIGSTSVRNRKRSINEWRIRNR